MVTQLTLRRKLQKKMKHKPYRKCPRCGNRMLCRIVEDEHGNPHLWKYCGKLVTTRVGTVCRSFSTMCGYVEELFWSGGGIGRHIAPRQQ